jgi:site-specific DNA recombinase
MASKTRKKLKKKAVGYIRVSTAAQAEKGESLDTQKRQIEDYCQQKGWTLIQIYEDAGVSGSKAEGRPGFIEMGDKRGRS